MFIVVSFDRRPDIDEVLAGSIPNAKDLDGQTTNHRCRAEVCAWIDIPCQLLNYPDYIDEDRMQPRLPQRIRCRPDDVCIELVMKASCAQHASHH